MTTVSPCDKFDILILPALMDHIEEDVCLECAKRLLNIGLLTRDEYEKIGDGKSHDVKYES